jgi:thiamine kinase-like enzyme
MVFVLNSENVFDYLAGVGLEISNREETSVRLIRAKNFNLLLESPGSQALLVKQETIKADGRQAGELSTEWKLQQLLPQLPELAEIVQFMPRILHCNPEYSIAINHFFDQYEDLSDYYSEQIEFPLDIATTLGQRLGLVHQLSFSHPEYQQQVDLTLGQKKTTAYRLARRLAYFSPSIFSRIPQECLQFLKLYQQYPSLGEAIQQLANQSTACCLVHNDLKLNNILVWPESEQDKIRLIDWEKASWGDPAGDLGMLLASYLELWLEGLVVGQELMVAESLQLATISLDLIQPTLFTLMKSYLDTFPQILTYNPQYIRLVLQYTGLSLIRRIEAIMESVRFFDNQGIIMLQVAKQLLCNPDTFVNTVFGAQGQELLQSC